MTEAEVVELLQSRSGRPTRVIATDGEPMDVQIVVRATPSDSPDYLYWVDRGGIPLSADGGRYYFYSNEIDRIEDVETGEVILKRSYS
jgi:hypothetical protein